MASLAGKKVPASVKSALNDFKAHKGSNAYDLAYKEAMERIEGLDPDSCSLAKQVLSWIACAERPLTATELRHALAVDGVESQSDEPESANNTSVFCEDDLPDLEDVLAVCNGLVTVEQHGGDVIKFVHYTTQEYFERTKAQWFPDAQRELAFTCIKYISSKAFSGPSPSDEEFEERERLNPFYPYAARYWGAHARAASVDDNEVVMRFLTDEAKFTSAAQSMFTSIALSKWNYRERGYSQAIVGPRTSSPLHIAAFLGLERAMQELIKRGADINARDNYGTQTPLSWAAGQGHESVVRMLLSQDGIQPDAEDALLQTPLHAAAQGGHAAVVKMLCDVDGVDPNRKNYDDMTPLYIAIFRRYTDVAEALLNLDRVDINTPNAGAYSPLILAIHKKNDYLVERLLSQDRLNIAFTDTRYGKTALTWAAGDGCKTIVRLLLEKDTEGATINLKDTDSGSTALHMASKRRGNIEIVERLLAVPSIDVNPRNKQESTPLMAACEAGDAEIVTALLAQKGIDVNARDKYGNNALNSPISYGRADIVRLLLAAGIEVDGNTQWPATRSPLLNAVARGRKPIVEQLLAAGANPYPTPDASGITPVSLAVTIGLDEIIELLHRWGAPIHR